MRCAFATVPLSRGRATIGSQPVSGSTVLGAPNPSCAAAQTTADVEEVAALRAPHMFRHIFERDGDTPRRLGRNARPDILLRARLDGGTGM